MRTVTTIGIITVAVTLGRQQHQRALDLMPVRMSAGIHLKLPLLVPWPIKGI
jgi:hypothetical protein